MILAKLKKILDEEFGPPFLPKGLVQATWVGANQKVLKIRIGRRDIDIDEKLKMRGSGTDLTC